MTLSDLAKHNRLYGLLATNSASDDANASEKAEQRKPMQATYQHNNPHIHRIGMIVVVRLVSVLMLITTAVVQSLLTQRPAFLHRHNNILMKNPLKRLLFSSSSSQRSSVKNDNDDHNLLELKAGATHDSGVSASPRSQQPQPPQQDEIMDAVIIGAGWAGLGAGNYFLQKQPKEAAHRPFQFCILEGHPDRIGGRSRTLSPIAEDYPDSMVELGSQWIHGVHRRNPVYQFAKHHDMILHYDRGEDDWGHGSAAVWYDTTVPSEPSETQTRMTERLDADTEAELRKKLQTEFYQYLRKYPRIQKKQWRQYRKERHKKHSYRNAIRSEPPTEVSVQFVLEEYCQLQQISPQDQQYLQWMVDMDLAQEYSGSLEDIDSSWWDHDQEYGGGDCHFGFYNPNTASNSGMDPTKVADNTKLANNTRGNVPGGYSALIQKFADPLLTAGKNGNHHNKDIIRCNCLVTSIDYTSDPVVIEYRQTTSSSDENARQPPQIHRVLARAVICTVPLGVLKAKSIQFTPPLPQPKCNAIERLGMGIYNKVVLVWKPEQRALLPWLFPLEHAAEDELGKPTRRMWMQRVHLPGEPQGPWTVCYNAHNHQGPNSPVVLYFFLAGRMAQQVETLSDEEIQHQAMTALRDWFDDTSIPEPQQVVLTRWHQDPLAGGSYSFYQVGSGPADRQELAQPVDNKVFFAGEATHLQYYATVHGALQAGQDRARTMWKRHAKQQSRKQKMKTSWRVKVKA